MAFYNIYWGTYGVDMAVVIFYHGHNNYSLVSWAQLPDPNPSQTNIDTLESILQNQMQTIVRRNTLPQDDADRSTNPNLQSRFWCSSDGTPQSNGQYICYRRGIVEIRWDAERPGYAANFIGYRIGS